MRYIQSQKQNIFSFLFLGTICSIPLSIQKFVFLFIPEMFDFSRELSSLFIYCFDIFIFLLIVFLLFNFKKEFFRYIFKNRAILLFLVFSAVSILYARNVPYAWYMWARLCEAFVFARCISFGIQKKIISFRAIAWTVGVAGSLEGALGIAQFVRQGSMGFKFLGEPIVTTHTPNVARAVLNGETYIRAFGTLPHANILAAFLAIGFLMWMYLFVSETPKRKTVYYLTVVAGMLLTLFGSAVTFSRSGWIVTGVSMILFFIFLFISPPYREKTKYLLGVVCALCLTVFLVFGPVIFPRAHLSRTERSVDERVVYNKLGLHLIQSQPLGVSVGNGVLVMMQDNMFVREGFINPWQQNPVHNIYILITEEIGVVGFLVFLIFLSQISYYVWKRRGGVEEMLILSIFSGVLLFGFFDHFFVDLGAGRLMFWLVLGIMMGLSTRAESVNKPS